MLNTTHRIFAIFTAFCLIFTQTAQAYSLVRLPHSQHLNNKGDVGKTLDAMGKSENVKALVTAMVMAGVLAELGKAINIGDKSLNSINAKSDFFDQLQKNLINQSASVVVNHAINGGDLRQQLEQGFRNAFIDTGAAISANWIGDMKQKDNFNNLTHKLAHAVVGCAAGAAKSGDCSSGALGAVVGEISAELYGDNGGKPLTAQQKTDTVNFARMMAGVAVAITGGDAAAINLAASTGGNAAENNWLNHNRPSLLALSEKERYDQAAKDCGNGNNAQCGVVTDLRNLSAERDRQLNQACGGAASSTCNAAAREAILAGNHVFTGPDGHTYAVSGTVPVLSAPDDPRSGTFQSQQAANLKEGLVIAGAPVLMAVPGTIGAVTSLTVAAGGSYQVGQGIGAIGDGQYGTGALDIGLGSLAIVGGSAVMTSALGLTTATGAANAGATLPASEIGNFIGQPTQAAIGEGEVLYGIRDAYSQNLWWTRTQPAGELQWRMDQAVLPLWNQATHIETLTVPSGQSLIGFEGTARGQGWYLGGGNQVYIPSVPSDWSTVRPWP
jgi:Possible hemagglutinin (DUF637)/Pre-toxin domain with VENN motif